MVFADSCPNLSDISITSAIKTSPFNSQSNIEQEDLYKIEKVLKLDNIQYTIYEI